MNKKKHAAVYAAAKAVVKDFNVTLNLHPLETNRHACRYFDHPGPVMWIEWIESKSKGEGTKALAALGQFCDQNNVLLRLYVDSGGTSEPNFLTGYYAQFGFELDDSGGEIMERPPKLAITN